MKKSLTSVFVLFAMLLCVNVASAQIDYSNNPKYMKYGSNPIEREANHKNYVFFAEAMKMKSFDDAEKRLEDLLVKAPGATENLYINGRRLYLTRIASAKDEATKTAYVEKLVKLQEIRNEHFANVRVRGTRVIWQTRLMDYMQYAPESTERILKYGKEAIEAGVASSYGVDADMVAQFFNVLTNSFMQDKVTPDDYLSAYEMISNALAKSKSVNAQERVKDCEVLFVQSGAADCTNIEKIYKPKYEANPADTDLIKKIMSYMVVGNCEGDFRMELTEKLFELTPTTTSAFQLGVSYATKGDMEKAKMYIDKAIELEENPDEDSKFQVRLAASFLANKNISDAIKYARAAVASDDDNGLAYLILAQAYGAASTQTGCKGVQQKAIYWVIVDVLYKAKTYLAKDTEQVDRINQLISSYSLHFPTVEELFFDPNMKEGSSYTVNCGAISGVTRVRAAK